MNNSSIRLDDKKILITGVSRPMGIGATLAKRFAEAGAASFGEAYEAIAKRFPAGRWGTPDDTADLALFLHSSYVKWITGEVIASHGGCKGEF